jgi:hypothetical protein
MFREQTPGTEKAREFVEKSREHAEKELEVRKKMEYDTASANATFKMVADEVSKNNTDWLTNALYNLKIQGDLIKFVELNPNINFSSNPWKRIKSMNPGLYNELKQIKKEKTGKGLSCGCKSVKFLPDNKKDLSHELIRLMGSYKSGNKAVFNELNAVVDELRRKGILTLKQSKKIYQSIKQ